MDCREAQELLSAAQDRETLHDATAASVAAHCRTCPQCAAFDAQLNALHEAGAPRAPKGLAERISAAIAHEAARAESARVERAAIAAAIGATRTGSAAPAPAAEPKAPESLLGRLDLNAPAKVPAWLTRGRLWFGTAAVAVAATVIVAVVVVRTGDEKRAAELSASRAMGNYGVAVPPTAGATDGQAVTAPAPSAVGIPDYVSWTGGVYAAAQSTEATASQLTTAGVLTSALNTGLVQSIPVLRSPGDQRTIYLALPGGGIQRFDPVLRLRKGSQFQLQTGVAFQKYGVWPQLPSNLPTPSASDGSPTFIASGTDDAGLTTYVRVGDTPDRGFALAPGTPPGDAAAGNPNWTWWLPSP